MCTIVHHRCCVSVHLMNGKYLLHFCSVFGLHQLLGEIIGFIAANCSTMFPSLSLMVSVCPFFNVREEAYINIRDIDNCLFSLTAVMRLGVG